MILFSVITPVLDGKRYMALCLESVLSQNYPYIEHIIIDGGSTDGTVEILRSYQAKYPHLIRFISEPDNGPGDAWNKGLKMAKGEILSWLGADDLLMPFAIQRVAEFFLSKPNAYFVYGGCNIVNEKGKVINKVKGKDFELEEMICGRNVIPIPSAFYRREVIDRVGWHGDKGEDRDYWIRVGKVFPIHRIEDTLSCYRVHSPSQTSTITWRMSLRQTLDGYQVVRDYSGSLFSKCCWRYYKVAIVELLRPVLGFSYPLLRRLIAICH